MFEDVTHKIQIIYRDRIPYIKRSFNNKNSTTLTKEYLIQSNIGHLLICPKTFNLSQSFYLEEYINKKNLILSKKNIVKIAQKLSLLHSIKPTLIPSDLLVLLKNHYVNKTKQNINYLSLIKAILRKISLMTTRNKFNGVLSFVKEFSSNPYQVSGLCLIHGDLNKNNILLSKSGDIKLIDWSDSRIDEPEADIAQFFYHFNLTSKQKKIFTNAYTHCDLNQGVLLIRHLLLLLYDIVQTWLLTNSIDLDKFNKIDSILKK